MNFIKIFKIVIFSGMVLVVLFLSFLFFNNNGVSKLIVGTINDGPVRITDNKKELDSQKMKITVVHDKTNPHAYNAEVVLSPDTYMDVIVSDSSLADGPSKLLLKHRFSNISNLPFIFWITGDLNQIFPNLGPGTFYTVNVSLKNPHREKPQVGDLVSEYVNTIDATTIKDGLEIKLTGLESCKAPNAGGYCVD